MSHGTHMHQPCHTYEGVMAHIRLTQVSHVARMNRSLFAAFVCVMAHI